MKDKFAVLFVPISVRSNGVAVSEEGRAYLSGSTIGVVNRIYEAINKKFLTSNNMLAVKNSLQNNIFCCCFNDGIVMFTLEANEGTLVLKGFFIPKNYLRTAWKLYREQLIYIAVAGECNTINPFQRTAEEMYKDGANAKNNTSEECKNALADVIEQVRKNTIPYSFTNSGLPAKFLPVSFADKVDSSQFSIQITDGSTITMYNTIVEKMKLSIKQTQPSASRLYFCHGTKKEFYNLKKEEIKAIYSKITAKGMIKKLEVAIKAEDLKRELWYFRLDDGSCSFVTEADDSININMRNNELPFDVFVFSVRAALKSISNSKASAVDNAELLEQDKIRKKSFGIFGKR